MVRKLATVVVPHVTGSQEAARTLHKACAVRTQDSLITAPFFTRHVLDLV